MSRGFATAVVVSTLHATLTAAPSPATLLDENRWFELRDTLAGGNASPLHRGAVASVFNDETVASRALGEVIAEDPASEAAIDAHILLAMLFHRQERHAAALAEIEAILKVHPENVGASQARAAMAPLAALPDLLVVRRQESTLRYETKRESLFNWFVPVVIQGQQQSLLMDTGAGSNLLAESEAQRLGLQVISSTLSTNNAAGQPIETRFALAETMSLGDCELRNVAFLIVPDAAKPFSLLKPGERGVLGLPVLLALRTLQWDSDGTLTVAFPSKPFELASANVCFESNMPLALARFQARPLMVELDTGAGSNFLYPRFAKDIPEILSDPAARRTKFSIGGVGGESAALDSIVLPSVIISVGGRDLRYAPATVQLEETDAASRRFHGLLGLPCLTQAKRVKLDFGAMRLELE